MKCRSGQESRNQGRIVWRAGAALFLGLVLAVSPAFSQQSPQTDTNGAGAQPQSQPSQAQQTEKPDWGPAGPPPDAVNGQIPPKPADTQNGSPSAGQPQQATPGRAPYQPNPPYGQNYQTYQNAPSGGPSGPVTLASGMMLTIRTSEPLDPKRVQPGDYFGGTVARSLFVGNVIAIPVGAEVTGRVVDVKKPGDLKGASALTLQLTGLTLGGHSYRLVTGNWTTTAPGKGGLTASNAVGGAVLGTFIGALAGGGPGAALGAVAGTGAGLGASAATRGPRAVIPPEAVISFRLQAPLTVQPVSYQEVQRLAESVAPTGPYGGRPPATYPTAYYGGYAPPPPPPAYYYYPYPYARPYPFAYAYPYPYVYWRLR